MFEYLNQSTARLRHRWNKHREDRRASNDSEERQLAKLQDRVGAIPMREAKNRTPVKVAGVIQSVTFNSKEQSYGLSAVLTDKTASVQLLWMGRKEIPGVIPGAKLVAQGMLANVNGLATIVNPKYTLLPIEEY
ncbi:hypothetical protein BK816_04705 [Boudabousia tangfeifanii]|uniref:DNA-binding protein n=1 Tax=Boudabousia tangfeifanii TaxID=1912795 RepID=A0A1D9MK45_9ACTO|nr:OB-fold nucleic acid binding domain-containing protein [Boudabousia tangfeifanii]AOZ72675.1 hypothetical protein BK816_04705 [Boudabousia tangfeifanii]